MKCQEITNNLVAIKAKKEELNKLIKKQDIEKSLTVKDELANILEGIKEEIVSIDAYPDWTKCELESREKIGFIDGISLISDSKVAISSNTFKIWDLNERKAILEQEITHNALRSIAVSGNKVFVTRYDQEIIIHDLETGEEKTNNKLYDTLDTSMTLKNGDFISGGDLGGTNTHGVIIFDPKTAQEKERLFTKEQKGDVRAFGEDNSGNVLVVCYNRGLTLKKGEEGKNDVYISNPFSGQLLHNFSFNLLHEEQISAFALTKDIKLVTGHQDGKIKIWDPETGKVIKELIAFSETERVRDIMVNSKNKIIVAGGSRASFGVDGELLIFNPRGKRKKLEDE